MSSSVQDELDALLKKIGEIVDKRLCQRILRESEKDDSIEVSDLSLGPATSKGDNYTSDMFRASIDYKKHGKNVQYNKTLILKVEPLTAGPQQDLISKSSLFTTEIAMMSSHGDGTLTQMNELLGASTTESLNAKGLYSHSEHPALLVMEDLRALGFSMADRRAGLDMDHCLLAIRNLARFHAGSLALAERQPKDVTRYDCGMFNRSQPSEMQQFFIQGTKSLAEEAATWPELDPKIPQKILKMSDKIYEMGCDACIARPGEFNVINHGDFWVNNMLFKYNQSNRPISHIFVDFQLCVYSSPAVDLNYFFNTSLTDEALSLHEETLVHEYTRTLATAMTKAHCVTDPPNIQQIKAMLRDRLVYGMIAAFTILPLLLADKGETKDLNEILAAEPGQAPAKNPLYGGKLFREAMLRRLPKFHQMGLLD